jgi:hypothetical protein
MSRQRLTGAARKVSLQVGQPFNPIKLFTGIFIPDALVKAKGISLGAKMTYARLTRYAGRRREALRYRFQRNRASGP